MTLEYKVRGFKCGGLFLFEKKKNAGEKEKPDT